MRKGALQKLRFIVADGVGGVIAHLIAKQIQQAVFRLEGPLVENKLEAGVEARVVPEPALDVFEIERRFAEEVPIGPELYKSPVRLLGRGAFALRGQFPF